MKSFVKLVKFQKKLNMKFRFNKLENICNKNKSLDQPWCVKSMVKIQGDFAKNTESFSAQSVNKNMPKVIVSTSKVQILQSDF